MTTDLIQRLQTEADQCHNDGAGDITNLLDDAAQELATIHARQVPAAPIAWMAESGEVTMDATQADRWRRHGGKVTPLVEHVSPASTTPVREMPETAWQPIGTAPKDGTHILAITEQSDTCYVMCWADFDMSIRPYLVAKSRTVGWHLSWDGEHFSGMFAPTRWMPLPDLPGHQSPFSCNAAARCGEPCGDCTQAWPKPASTMTEGSA